MSFVGPRPVTKSEVDTIYGANAVEILRAKPGLAGLWQVSGRNHLTSAERRGPDFQWGGTQAPRPYVLFIPRTLSQRVVGKRTMEVGPGGHRSIRPHPPDRPPARVEP